MSNTYAAYRAGQASERETLSMSGPRISNIDPQEAIRLIRDLEGAVVCATFDINDRERERLIKRKLVDSEGALFKALTGRDPTEGERKPGSVWLGRQ